MTTLSLCSDQEVWDRFRAGDDVAYEHIYRRHAGILLRYGYQIAKDKALVEDCVHDIFAYIFQHRASLGQTTAIKYYLFKSLRRKIVEVLEKRNRTNEHHFSHLRSLDKAALSGEEKIISDESSDLRNKNLTKFIKDLPARQQEAIFLLYYSELSYPEVASVMSLNVRTVYNHVHAGLETLRAKLREPALAQMFLAYLFASLTACFF